MGDTLTYTVTATNNGTANLTDVVVSDRLITPTGGTTPCALVAPSGTCTLVGTYVVTAADVTAGQIDNTGTADSDQTAPVTDDETVLVPPRRRWRSTSRPRRTPTRTAVVMCRWVTR